MLHFLLDASPSYEFVCVCDRDDLKAYARNGCDSACDQYFCLKLITVTASKLRFWGSIRPPKARLHSIIHTDVIAISRTVVRSCVVRELDEPQSNQ